MASCAVYLKTLGCGLCVGSLEGVLATPEPEPYALNRGGVACWAVAFRTAWLRPQVCDPSLFVFIFVITLDTGPTRPLSLELSDTTVYDPRFRVLVLGFSGQG